MPEASRGPFRDLSAEGGEAVDRDWKLRETNFWHPGYVYWREFWASNWVGLYSKHSKITT